MYINNRTNVLAIAAILALSFQLFFSIQLTSAQILDSGCIVVNFEDIGLQAGDVPTNYFPGVTITTHDPTNHPPMIFDSDNPTGDDDDLGVNSGNILIISEDGDASDPDDNNGGGTIFLTFASPVEAYSVEMADVEAGVEPTINAYDAAGNLLFSGQPPAIGDGSFQLFGIEATDVSQIEIIFPSSGSIGNIYCPPSLTPISMSHGSADLSESNLALITALGSMTILALLSSVAVFRKN